MKKISIGLVSFVMVGMYLLGCLANAILIQEGTVSQQEKGILIGISLIAFAILCAFFHLMYKTWQGLQPDQAGYEFNVRNVAKYAGVISLCYLPYLLLRFPGHVDVDTYWEILEVYGLDALQDHHPFFDTLLFGAFWKIGGFLGSHLLSVLLYAILQSLCTATVFAMCMVYMRKYQVPRIIRRIAFVFAAFYPAIPMMSQTMAKDTLHAWLYALFFLGFVEAIRSKGEILKSLPFDVAGVVVILLLLLTKKTGIYAVAISIVFLLVVCRNRLRLLVVFLAPLILYLGVWNGIVLHVLDVTAGESREMMSIPSQQVAALLKYNAEDLTEEDYEILSGVYNNVDTLAEGYSPTRADSTKSQWIEESTSAERRAFYKWYLSQWFKHPKTMVYAMVANDYGIFAVDQDSLGNESYIFYQDSMVAVGEGDGLEGILAAFSVYDVSGEEVHNVIASSYRPVWADELSAAFDTVYLRIAALFSILFSKVLYATWIPLVVLGYALYSKNLRMFVACVPVGMLTAMLLVGPIVLPRYMASSLYVIPLLLAVPFVLQKRADEA